MLTEQERKDLISRLNISFCTPALWKDRESFLNLTDEQYKNYKKMQPPHGKRPGKKENNK